MRAWAFLGGVALAACGAGTAATTASSSGAAHGGATTTGATSTSGAGGELLVDGGSGGGSDCASSSKLVYLVSLERDLYSFDPSKLAIAKIGALDCPSSTTPYDLTIARDGTALVVYDDGTVFHVDLADAHCTPSGIAYDGSGYAFGGTAFASPGGQETLFTSAREFPVGQAGNCTCGTIQLGDAGVQCFPIGKGLARLDGATKHLVPIGDYNDGLAQQILSLTGAADGRLFGYFNGYAIQCGASQPAPDGPRIAELDPKTGAVTSLVVAQNLLVGQNATWAFAFWGGDVWLFSGDGGNSRVTQYRLSTDKAFVVAVPDAGMRVVGAGVSTCAPLGPLH